MTAMFARKVLALTGLCGVIWYATVAVADYRSGQVRLRSRRSLTVPALILRSTNPGAFWAATLIKGVLLVALAAMILLVLVLA